jgi:hypothetical protein
MSMIDNYKEQAEQDVVDILTNHEDELAEALVKWRQGDTSQSFQPHEFGVSDAIVDENHSLSGIAIDMEEAVSILQQIPEEHHETDRGQWLEDTCVKTVIACGSSTYEHYVEHLFAEAMEKIAEQAKNFSSLRKPRALSIIQKYLADNFE